MGTDPIQDGYEPGADCAVCNLSSFNSVTPRYIEVLLDGVTICPGLPQAPSNGVYLLTQIAACVWTANVGVWTFQYRLNVGNSAFWIGFHPFLAFFASVDIECLVSFTNELGACDAITRANGGTATMFWGPTIGP